MFYKAVVQSVLLYGSESWVVAPAVLKVLEGFHHRVARKLSGMQPPYHPREDRWEYPSIEEALEVAGMYTMEHYLNVRRNTLVENIATRPILELCRGAERQSGSAKKALWWHQIPDE